RILARAAQEALTAAGIEAVFFDLAEKALPLCDGAAAYGDPIAREAGAAVEAADGIFVATPIYNFDTNAAFKNFVELTGRAWADKVAGFLCAAGGQGSYMSIMAVANSLMLDFRTVVIPRFVYADGSAFQGEKIADAELSKRVEALAGELVRFTTALRG
ncbi:MAG: NADPH-dependent FMN reductase, partial [Pirellulaceae bacterium]